MSTEEFQANLTAYGPDLAKWPDPEREAALALLSKSEHARQIHEIALRLKAELGARDITAPKGLVDRIVEKATGNKGGNSSS